MYPSVVCWPVVPIAFHKLRRSLQRLLSSDEATPYLDGIRNRPTVKPAIAVDDVQAENVEIFADPPEKAPGRGRDGQNMLWRH